ncbi:MAG: hypothetical protein PHU72_00030 [Dethiosulfovibrio sp.]|nr:hypothetical protein [Dethiosulfovibrio sp.]
MKKLAAIGGLEIIKEETHLSTVVRDESEYLKPYRIVAKIPGVEGMYVEAHDPLIEIEKNTGDYPELWGASFFEGYQGGRIALFRMEAKEEDKALPPSTERDIAIHIPKHDDFGGDVAISFLFAPQQPSQGVFAKGVREKSGGSSNVTFPFVQSGSRDFVLTKDAPGATVSISGASLGITATAPETVNLPFLVTGASPNLPWPWESRSSTDADWRIGIKFYGKTNPVIMAGVRIRFSPEIGVDGELVSPSAWGHVPISASVMSTDSGLFFFNGEGVFSSLVGVSFIDTSNGNNYGEGRCIGIYENYPKTFALAPSAPKERILIGGTTANPGGTVVMQPFAPNPPISVDSVSGGPVVTDLFAYNSEEIRGSVEGLLAARDNLPVGSVGWLDGKRYRVHLPGRMLQIG